MRRALRPLLFLLMAWMLALPAARAALTIEITGGGASQTPIAIVPFGGEAILPVRLTSVVGADLQRSGLFSLVDTGGLTALPTEPDQIDYGVWRGRGAEAVVIGSVVPVAGGNYEVRFRVMDAVKRVQILGLAITATPGQLRLAAHQVADAIYQALTGDPGVFTTKITYVVKRGKRYELQVADADGFNAQTVLASNEPIISPAWSPDGSQLAYVSFERKKPVIYTQSLLSGKRQVVANFKGSNSAPAWSPDGKRLAVVLTKDGESQIYMINADGSGVRRLAESAGIDTEPSFSPDGQWIIFTSDRGGSPQIYRMPADGGQAERLTFEGSYNVSPAFAPDGKSFVFVHRSGGRFQVAVQDLATRQIQVLSDTSFDEAPSFAPNGRIILYATEIARRGVLAAVSGDGRVRQRFSEQGGDVREPSWGPMTKGGPE